MQPANLSILTYIHRFLMFSTSEGLHFPQLSGHLDIAVGCLCCSQAETKRRVAWSERWPGWFGNEKGWRDIWGYHGICHVRKPFKHNHPKFLGFFLSFCLNICLNQGPKVYPKKHPLPWQMLEFHSHDDMTWLQRQWFFSMKNWYIWKQEFTKGRLCPHFLYLSFNSPSILFLGKCHCWFLPGSIYR